MSKTCAFLQLKGRARADPHCSLGEENQTWLNVFFNLLCEIRMREKESRFITSLERSVILFGFVSVSRYFC